MKGNRRKDTQPEIVLRRRLWAMGMRYRLHLSDLPGNPDLAFPRSRVAVFVDGDFWHGKDWKHRRKKLQSGANADYWIPKIEANRERDERNADALRQVGWLVIRIWESDVLANADAAADKVAETVRRRSE